MLRVDHVIRNRIIKPEHRAIRATRDNRDNRGAAIKRGRPDVFLREALIRRPHQGEIAATESDVVTHAVGEEWVIIYIQPEVRRRQPTEEVILARRIIDGERGSLIEVNIRTQRSVTRQIDRTLPDDESPTVDPAVQTKVLRVSDGERARAILLDGIEQAVPRPGRDLRAA